MQPYLPGAAIIICHTVAHSPNNHQPQWVPTKGTTGHSTATLCDRWPPFNTLNPMLWLETKVLKTGEPQGQDCSCWVGSRSPRQYA